MGHEHPVYDTDRHFLIDPITRVITNASSKKITLMQYDHDCECFSFDIPKVIEGHDMTLCNDIKVHFTNVASNRVDRNEGVYNVTDFAVSESDNEIATFTWTISDSATQYAGSLSFLVQFKCTVDGNVLYRYSTDINNSISIRAGMNNGDVISKNNPDILAELEDRITALEDGMNNQVQEPCGITYVESSDLENLVNIRDLESGTYVFKGRFRPYAGSTATLAFSSSLLVNVVKRTNDTQVMVFYPVNNCIQYLYITDTEYTRTNVYLNDLATKSEVEDVLPSVTTTDAGKFLRVSSEGVWAAESVPVSE